MKMLKQLSRKNNQVQQDTEQQFYQKNKAVIDNVLTANTQIKAFAIHLMQNCEVKQDGETVDVTPQLMSIVEHVERMSFVFNHMKKLK